MLGAALKPSTMPTVSSRPNGTTTQLPMMSLPAIRFIEAVHQRRRQRPIEKYVNEHGRRLGRS